MLPVAVARFSSDGNALCYVCTSGFADDVMFSHNRLNGPESKTTRMFRPVRQVATPEAKSAVSDCIALQPKQYSVELQGQTVEWGRPKKRQTGTKWSFLADEYAALHVSPL